MDLLSLFVCLKGPVKSVKASGRDKSPNKEHEAGEDGEAGGSGEKLLLCFGVKLCSSICM